MPNYPPVSVDLKFITAREMRDLREKAGLSTEEINNPLAADEPERAMAAFAWVVTRRDHPDVTFDDAWDIPISLVSEEPDPTSANS